MFDTVEERRAEWLRMLRSGTFAQTTDELHDSHGYCCLGVACKLYQTVTGEGRWLHPDDESSFVVPSSAQDGECMPSVVQEWFGFRTNVGATADDSEHPDLASKNDSGWTFKEIADFVETNPEGLWK